jgi:deoxyribonuclease V
MKRAIFKKLWPIDIHEAKIIQDKLRKRVKIQPLKKEVRIIAGVDASFISDRIIAVVSNYEYPEMKYIEDTYFIGMVKFPYIPGMLSFREGPAIVSAIKKLSIEPDVILFDGHGIAHPRFIGIASHIGVILDISTIGCAKSCLVGQYREPGQKKGDWTYLYYKNIKVGAVLRTRDLVKPLFVSPGHKIDIEHSVDIVLNSVLKYRLPEPLRRADRLSKVYKIEFYSDRGKT